MQNKILKLLSRKHKMTPTDEIHESINLLKVSDICECNVLTFVNDAESVSRFNATISCAGYKPIDFSSSKNIRRR